MQTREFYKWKNGTASVNWGVASGSNEPHGVCGKGTVQGHNCNRKGGYIRRINVPLNYVMQISNRYKKICMILPHTHSVTRKYKIHRYPGTVNMYDNSFWCHVCTYWVNPLAINCHTSSSIYFLCTHYSSS